MKIVSIKNGNERTAYVLVNGEVQHVAISFNLHITTDVEKKIIDGVINLGDLSTPQSVLFFSEIEERKITLESIAEDLQKLLGEQAAEKTIKYEE